MELLAINRQGPSMISNGEIANRRTEEVPCATCGALCLVVVYTDGGGAERRFPTTPVCDSCSEVAAQKAKDARLAAELAKVVESQQCVWDEESGVGSMGVFTGKEFEDFERSRQPRAYDAVSTWSGGSLILASPGCYGLGKTHLVSALAWKLLLHTEAAKVIRGYACRLSCPVYITNEARLMGRVRHTFNRHDDEEDSETEEGLYRALLRPGLLVIDDVGKVRPRDLSFLQSVYYRIIDDRYIEEKDVILTTNLSLDELEQHIGGACADRMREMCGKDGIIVMSGESYRRVK